MGKLTDKQRQVILDAINNKELSEQWKGVADEISEGDPQSLEDLYKSRALSRGLKGRAERIVDMARNNSWAPVKQYRRWLLIYEAAMEVLMETKDEVVAAYEAKLKVKDIEIENLKARIKILERSW